MSVIKIENLWKEYRLGVIGHGTLTHDLQSWWARVRGKEDPNAKIAPMLAGQEKQIDGDHFWALRDINLEIKQGEILGIIGKNGAGKSTLLKILSRVTAPTRGDIKVKGRIASLLEVGTGFHPELTGRENIFMNGAILGMSKLEIKSKLDEIVDFSEIESFIDTPVKRYSSGMYVRLAFAVAAHLEPEILIIDEVLAVGDAEFQKKCLGKMNEISKNGRTVLFVSHNMGMLQQLCSSCVCLTNGGVKEYGDTKTIIRNYLSEAFVHDLGPLFKVDEDDSKHSQLTALQIINQEGKVCEMMSCDESVTLELTYHVNKKIKGLYGYLSIMKKDQTVVMVSDSFDCGNNTLDSLDKGLHKITLVIPKRSLAPDSYYVYLNFAGSKAEGYYVDSPGIVAGFQLDDSRTPRGNTRGGYFSSIIEWEVSGI